MTNDECTDHEHEQEQEQEQEDQIICVNLCSWIRLALTTASVAN